MHRPVNPTMMVPASINAKPMAASRYACVGSRPVSFDPAVVQSPKESSSSSSSSGEYPSAKTSLPSPVDPDQAKECNERDEDDNDKNGATTKDTSSSSSSSDIKIDDDISAMKSRREQIRAKLRASEKKLLSFTSTSSSDGGFLNQMATVQADLKKIEEQKSQLEVELTKLKCATDNDDFLKEKMLGIQHGFDQQVAMITSLQDDVQCKDDEIDRLHEELVRKIRRIVELEFDLETHEVHYTNYAAEQFKLGEAAIEEIQRGRERERAVSAGPGAMGYTTTTTGGDDYDNDGDSMSPRKAQQLITKLIEDLDDLEERYKCDKLDYATQLQKANMLNDQLRTRMTVLENELLLASSGRNHNSHHQNKTIAEHNVETITAASTAEDAASVAPSPAKHAALDHDAILPGCDPTTNQFLRKRVQTLEARRALACKDMERMHAEFRALKKTVQSEKEEHKNQIKGLRTENEALKARIAELEAPMPPTSDNNSKAKKNGKVVRRRSILGKIGFGKDATAGTGGAPSQHHSEQHYEEIEQRIQEAFNKIHRLEAERDIKDRQIATLKHEVSSLRISDISNGNLEGTEFSDIDTEILRSPAYRRMTHDGGECDTTRSSSMTGGMSSSLGANNSHDDYSYVMDLQLQLQETQQLLVKKDQELVLEQAKAASTAAGLLTRITELSSVGSNKVDT